MKIKRVANASHLVKVSFSTYTERIELNKIVMALILARRTRDPYPIAIILTNAARAHEIRPVSQYRLQIFTLV